MIDFRVEYVSLTSAFLWNGLHHVLHLSQSLLLKVSYEYKAI